MRRGVGVVAAVLALAFASASAWGRAAFADSSGVGMPAAGVEMSRADTSRADTTSADMTGVESVDAFWKSLDPPWYEPLTVRDLDFGLSDAGLDSLVGEGDRVIARMIAGRPWQLGVKPLERFRFNRVEGLVLGGEVRLARAGVRQASLTSGLDYGFAWKRCTHSHRLDVPLLTAKPRDAEGYLVREPWVKLAFEAEGGRTIERFGGDRRPLNDPSALITGDDPNQYYEMEAWQAGVRYSPHPALTFRVGGGAGEHRVLGTRTSWSLFGGRDAVRTNGAASGLDRNSYYLNSGWKYKEFEIATELWWHQVTEESLNTLNDAQYSWHKQHTIKGTLRYHDHAGNKWIFQNEWYSYDRAIAPEWNVYLGGYGTLRGIPAGSLMGNSAIWFSAECRPNCDRFYVNSLPLLSHLQCIVLINGGFVNNNRTYHHMSKNKYWLLSMGFVKSMNAFSQSEHLYILCGINSNTSVSFNNLQLILAYEP